MSRSDQRVTFEEVCTEGTALSRAPIPMSEALPRSSSDVFLNRPRAPLTPTQSHISERKIAVLRSADESRPSANFKSAAQEPSNCIRLRYLHRRGAADIFYHLGGSIPYRDVNKCRYGVFSIW